MITEKRTESLVTISTVDALIHAISTAIFDGRFEPGAQLRESEIADLYRVSRNSVREALLNLTKQGLLKKETNRGVFVPELTPVDIIDLYRVRGFFEEYATGIIAKEKFISDELRKAAELFNAFVETTPFSEVVETDVRFHRAIVDSLNSKRLSALYSSLLIEFRLCISQSKNYFVSMQAIKEKHKRIIESIENGEPKEAVSNIQQHLESSCNEHLSGLK